MVRYSFLVGLFHPLLHAGLSRRLRSLTATALYLHALTEARPSGSDNTGRSLVALTIQVTIPFHVTASVYES